LNEFWIGFTQIGVAFVTDFATTQFVRIAKANGRSSLCLTASGAVNPLNLTQRLPPFVAHVCKGDTSLITLAPQLFTKGLVAKPFMPLSSTEDLAWLSRWGS